MESLARFVIRTRWVLIAVATVITGVLGAGMPRLTIEEDEHTWFADDNPVLERYKEYKGLFEVSGLVMVAWTCDDPLAPEEHALLAALIEELGEIPQVQEATSLVNTDDIVGSEGGLDIRPLLPEPAGPEARAAVLERITGNPLVNGTLIGRDRRVLAVVLEVEAPTEQDEDDFVAALDAVLAAHGQGTDRHFHVGGELITDTTVNGMMASDMLRFYPLSVLLVTVVVLALFRRLSAVIAPQITVSAGVVWTLGLKGWVGSPLTPVSSALFALIATIGVASAIHLMSHFQVEFARLGDKQEALVETFRRAAKPCLFTAITTMVGFGSLLVSSIAAVQHLGLFAAFGILSVFGLAIVLIPTSLLIAEPIPYTAKSAPGLLDRGLAGIARFNQRHPAAIVVVHLLAMAAFATGLPRIRVEGSMLRYFKASTTLRQDAEFLDTRLAGVSSTEVVIRGEPGFGKEPETLRAADALQRFAETQPGVILTTSLADYVKLISRALHAGDPAHFAIPPTRAEIAQGLMLYEMSDGTGLDAWTTVEYDALRISVRTQEMSEEQRAAIGAAIGERAQELFGDVTVTGFDSLVREVSRAISSTMMKSLSLAFGLILVLMVILFGLRGGLVSVLPNLFPLVFVMGLLGLGDFGLNAATSIIASVAIGIVVDDTIHVFAHYRHNVLIMGDPQAAMLASLTEVGKALVSTTLILACGFGIFLISGMRILSDFGLLTGLAIIVALLGDLFLGPVLLTRLRVFYRG